MVKFKTSRMVVQRLVSHVSCHRFGFTTVGSLMTALVEARVIVNVEGSITIHHDITEPFPYIITVDEDLDDFEVLVYLLLGTIGSQL